MLNSFRLRWQTCLAGLSCGLCLAAWGQAPAAKAAEQNVTAMVSNSSRLHAETGGIAVGLRKMQPKLIVVGFLGGRVRQSRFTRQEMLVAEGLEQRFPGEVDARSFPNHEGRRALSKVLALLDTDGDGKLSAAERKKARVVIYGHSWGASETVALADALNGLGVGVLLTVQVDSVQKPGENDRRIPPNVQKAVNFYQSEGWLRGRRKIEAVDPERTEILGNFESRYRRTPVKCAEFPWYARAFMREHIEIENDPEVWDRVEALIRTEVN